jgi:tetratricopeptide (TPR) repeat protein
MVWIIFAAIAVTGFGISGFVIFWNSPTRKTSTLTLLAERELKRRDWQAAERLFRQSLDIAKMMREPARSRAQALIEIECAQSLYRRGSLREAEELLRKGLAKTGACYPKGHELVQNGYVVWGDLCVDEQRYTEAESHYRKALEGDEHTGNKAMTIFDLQRLGDALIRQQRREEAREVIERAIALETSVVHEQLEREGKNAGEFRITSMSMPDLHFCREQYEDARRLYREKVEYWEKQVTRPDNIDVGHLQMRLAFSEAQTGDATAAIEMYARAESTFQREWGESHPKAAAARMAKESVLTV